MSPERQKILARIKKIEDEYDPQWDDVRVTTKRAMEFVVEVLKECL